MHWATFWATFFTNASGHPACKVLVLLLLPLRRWRQIIKRSKKYENLLRLQKMPDAQKMGLSYHSSKKIRAIKLFIHAFVKKSTFFAIEQHFSE
jgi:hypothetical protein